MLLLCISHLCLFLTERVRWTSWLCQKASIQYSSQPRSNDPCVDPCVVSRLTLPLFPVLDNQSIVCLSVSLPLFRSFPLIWFSFSLVCIFLFPSLSLCLWAQFQACTSVRLKCLLNSLVWSKLASKFHQFTVTYHAMKILSGEECTFQTWQTWSLITLLQGHPHHSIVTLPPPLLHS